MEKEKVFAMAFSKVFTCLLQKAQRKGRSAEEVYTVTAWLTGYTREEIEAAASSTLSYGDFFRNAPGMNPNREMVTGSICGIRIAEIEDPLMKDIRILDKLVDELAKGKAMEKVLRN